jgi:hypothetical protein
MSIQRRSQTPQAKPGRVHVSRGVLLQWLQSSLVCSMQGLQVASQLLKRSGGFVPIMPLISEVRFFPSICLVSRIKLLDLTCEHIPICGGSVCASMLKRGSHVQVSLSGLAKVDLMAIFRFLAKIGAKAPNPNQFQLDFHATCTAQLE